MADGWTINDSQLKAFIQGLNSSSRAKFITGAKWIRKFTLFTEVRMRRYASSKSARSTGDLAASIRHSYNFSPSHLSGTVFVPERIKYQFAAEYGFKKRFVIQGKPLMAFPQSSWKKARRASSVVRLGKRGFYIFSRVRRGRYKGRRFTEKAFDDLLKYYSQNEGQMLEELGQSLLFAKF